MNRRFAFHAYQTVFPESRSSRIAGLRSISAILAVGAVGLAVPTWVCFRLGSDLTVVALVYLIKSCCCLCWTASLHRPYFP